MIIIGIILSALEYSGLIPQFFSHYNHPILHSIKFLSSSFIYSISGFFLGFFNILDYFNKFKIKVTSIFFLSFYLILGSKDIWFVKHYVIRKDYISIGLFLIFASLPFDKIKNKYIVIIIKQITSYTGGVYYLHFEIYSIFNPYLNPIKYKKLSGCILNYLFCYLICFCGSKAFKKSKLKYLFI